VTTRIDVLIDGAWEFPDHAGAEPIVVRNPWDGSELGMVPACDADDVRRAVLAARRALAQGWPQHERAALLDRLAERAAVPDVAEGLARTVCTEAAKPITTARVEVQRFISTVRFSAAACRALAGEMVPMQASAAGAGKLGLALAVPVGVVGAISPFNFPLNLVAHKVAPAIAAGCPVVLKPASATPLSAIALARLLDECGLPPGWLNVVTGGGGTVGNALVDDPDVAYISFTGSVDVGWGIRARAPRKKTGLELGSTAPLLVAADGDWVTAARKAATAAFSHAGQSCISTQRIYVDRSVAAAFTDALAGHVADLVVGDPLDPATDVSAVISTAERDRVRE
jgi:acyl-CoA reductase-like NAD-dependent aldehyde dehydrogenase